MGRGKSRQSLNLIAAAYAVLERIHPASVRACCYQLFTLGVIANMSKLETNRVSMQLTQAREQGQIPWSWIVDNERRVSRVSAWDDPAAFVDTVQRSYRRDRWSDQPEIVEVWSEKATIAGVLAPVLHKYGVTARYLKGYGSATAIKDIADESMDSDKPFTALYLGDWDCSGLHMSAVDLPARIAKYGGSVTLVRLALTRADISSGLPSFSAETKRRDSRYQWFVRRHGRTCWELDALDPNILRQRVEDAIVNRLDGPAWTRADVAEAAEIESLTAVLGRWTSITRQAQKYGGAGVQTGGQR